jgi:uncharacterized phage protein (TIGR02218 family)
VTYTGSETSAIGGKPTELYRFVRGSRTWLYTTADTPITYLGDTYSPQMMRRGDLPQNEERDNATLDLYLDPRLDVVAEFISGATARPTDVIVLRRHRDEPVAGQHAVIFSGTVGVVAFTEAEVHFSCVPLQKSMARKVPRWLYQPQCNHMLYDQFCGVDPAAYTVPGTIGAIVGRTLTVPEAAAQADGWYNGGWVKDGETYVFIQQHVGDQLTLLSFPGNGALVVGDAVTITAGCDRLASTCAAKFGNLPNFMGFPFMPTTNPFNGLM